MYLLIGAPDFEGLLCFDRGVGGEEARGGEAGEGSPGVAAAAALVRAGCPRRCRFSQRRARRLRSLLRRGRRSRGQPFDIGFPSALVHTSSSHPVDHVLCPLPVWASSPKTEKSRIRWAGQRAERGMLTSCERALASIRAWSSCSFAAFPITFSSELHTHEFARHTHGHV